MIHIKSIFKIGVVTLESKGTLEEFERVTGKFAESHQVVTRSPDKRFLAEAQSGFENDFLPTKNALMKM